MEQSAQHENTQGHTQATHGPNNYESSSSNTRIHEVDDAKHNNNNSINNGLAGSTNVQSPHQTHSKRKRHLSDRDNPRDSLHVQFNSTSLDSCSSSSSDDDESSSTYSAVRAPDGGWGWVVVMASFFVNLIADGITFSIGILFVDLLAFFGEGRSRTAWIVGVFMAMPLLSGPIASFLTDRFGCRRVSIFGAILATIGFVISAFSESMFVLFLTFGVFAGFGLSLCYVASVVIVAYYFDNLRATATGISVSGSGIGTIIFAPLTRFLLGEYGLRGTILILAGLVLNLCVCGALMRDLPGQQDRLKAQRLAKRKKRTKSQRTTLSSTDSLTQPPNYEPEFLARANPRISSSLLCIPTFVRSGEKVLPEVLELMSTHRNAYNRILQNYPDLMSPSRSVTDSDMIGEQAAAMSIKSAPPLTLTPPPMDPLLAKMKANPAPRRLTAYLRDLRVHRHSLTYRGAMLNINRYHLRASSCPDIYRNSMTTIAHDKQECYSGIWEFYYLLAEMLDFSYFLDIRFLLFAISNFLLYTWYDVPYVYLYESAVEMGFSETESSYLISVIGTLNLIGEILLGWIGDRPGVNPTIVYAACMLFCGGATALLPALAPSYNVLLVFAGSFGLFIAANYSLTSIILVELISIERFTNAYGLLLLVQGIANLIGPPLAGRILDATNSYHLAFYLAGIFIALSGVLLLILPSIDRIRNYRKSKKQAKTKKQQTSLITPAANTKCNGNTLPWDATPNSHV